MDQASGLRGLLERDPAGARIGRIEAIAVASGKGGVGKTFVAANLAVLAGRAGRRVLLIDGDLGLANLDVVLGLRCRHTLGDVLRGDVGLAAALVPGPRNVSVLSAGSGVEWLGRLDAAGLAVLRDELAKLDDRFDLVVVDCAAGIGHNVRFFAEVAGRVLLTMTPEPTALADAYALLKALTTASGIELNVVVNQALSPADARDAFGRLRVVSERFLRAELSYLGQVPRDEDVRLSVRARQPVVSYSANSRAAHALDGVYRALWPLRVTGGARDERGGRVGARGVATVGAHNSSTGAEAP